MKNSIWNVFGILVTLLLIPFSSPQGARADERPDAGLPTLELSDRIIPPDVEKIIWYDTVEVIHYKDGTVGLARTEMEKPDSPYVPFGYYLLNGIRVPRSEIVRRYSSGSARVKAFFSYGKFFVPSGWLNQEMGGAFSGRICKEMFLSEDQHPELFTSGSFSAIYTDACIGDFFVSFRRFEKPLDQIQQNWARLESEKLATASEQKFKSEHPAEYADFVNGRKYGYQCKAYCQEVGADVTNYGQVLSKVWLTGIFPDKDTALRQLTQECKARGRRTFSHVTKAYLGYEPACVPRTRPAS